MRWRNGWRRSGQGKTWAELSLKAGLGTARRGVTRRLRREARAGCERFIHCDGCEWEMVSYGECSEGAPVQAAHYTRDMSHARGSLDVTVAGSAAKGAEGAARLKGAGVRWITGGGSEILTEEFRARHSKFKYTVAEYFEAQRAIVDAGLKTRGTR